MKKINSGMIAADLAECAIFVALMVATGTVLHIPTPLMDITFQTLIGVLAGLLLGWKKGAIAMAVYAVMGLIGIPVFTRGGGIYYVFEGTFGYIIGFIVSAAVAGVITGNGEKTPFWRYMVAAIVACLVDYACGIGYYIILHFAYFERTVSSLGAIVVAHIGWFLPKDIVLCALAAVLAWRVTPLVRSKRYLQRRKDGADK